MVKLSEGVPTGANKGHIVTKLKKKPNKRTLKAKLPKRKILVKQVIREVGGLAPYEKRIIDVIKIFGGGSDKKVYKVAKKRLGTHKRALRKRDEMKTLYTQMRK